MDDLRVELYGIHVGELVGRDNRTFDFVTSRDAFATYQLNSPILSVAVPLAVVQPRGKVAERRRNFFRELLPEGELREFLRLQAGLTSVDDTIGMLARYGRDVAGAIQIYDPSDPTEPRTPFATDLNDNKIAEMLEDARQYPIGNSKKDGKSLINGVQTKIVLVREGGRWKQAHDGYPSTHILKPRQDDKPTTIFDEEYGSRFARSLGLAAFDTHIERFNGVDALVVERYDRDPTSPDSRVHQEDMNQALGASKNEKYQNLGGRVSLKRIADVFAKIGDAESLRRLLVLNTLSLAVGNLDLHAKNISVLHPFNSHMTLAPAYDVVPQAHHPNDQEMALMINGKYQHAVITAEDLVLEAESWGGVRDPRTIVLNALATVAEVASTEDPLTGSYVNLKEDIQRFADNLLAGRPAGAS